jgi:hypothetical protein
MTAVYARPYATGARRCRGDARTEGCAEWIAPGMMRAHRRSMGHLPRWTAARYRAFLEDTYGRDGIPAACLARLDTLP